MDKILLVTGASSDVGMKLIRTIYKDYTTIFLQYFHMNAELSTLIDDLGNDLTALANILFQRLASRIERLLTLIQPIIFGIIAIVIVGLYLRLLLPIYHSMQGVI